MHILGFRKAIFLTIIVVFAMVFSAPFMRSSWNFFMPLKPIAEVKLRNFVPGTEIDYRIISGTEVIAHNAEIIRKDGVLSLPLNFDMIKDKAEDIVKYELSLRGPKDIDDETASAEMLSVLLNLNKSTGDVSVSASGLDEYAGIVLKNNGQEEKLSSDWAGLFSADIISNGEGPRQNRDASFKMAFQNSGISGDLESLNPGEIEVFFGIFGDSSGSNIGTVQSLWSSSLIRMTEELSAVMVLQTHIIGMFFDASIQMRTQRKHQELMARAHKDYHPSEQMCRIGTFIRSVAQAETKSEVDKHFLNKMLMEEYMGVENTVGTGSFVYGNSKIRSYVLKYCDTKDSDGAPEAFCNVVTGATTAADMERLNKDIDYTRTLTTKLTLDVDFTNVVSTTDEEDIIALSKQLYFPGAFDVGDIEALKQDPRSHYNSRSYAAKMGVAHNSFINIVGMKASAPAGSATTATTGAPPPPAFGQVPPPVVRPAPATLTEDAGWAYMKAMMREFGLVNDADIAALLGERPSYYAQMEVLTKKIYQSPDFYTNLYDKPANVKRIGASLDALSLMHQRDRFESLLRLEMLTAVMVEEGLNPHVEEVNANMYEAMQASQIAD